MPDNPAGQASDRPVEPQLPVILAFGLKPERFLGDESRIDAVLEVPSAEESDVLVQALASGIESGGHVIAVLPHWFPPEGALRLAMARSMLDTDRVAVHETALPPLAGAVLCSLASALGRHVPSAGVLVSLLPELEEELHVFTWLGSVSGLSAPAPSFGQHLASLGPNSAFGVSSWPEPSVHKLSSGEPGVPLPEIARPSRMVVAPRSGDASWARETVNHALGGLPVSEVEATPNGPSWWGTSKVVESVVFPADVAELAADLVAELETWLCRWCRELVAHSPCPLCGHRGRPVRRRAPAPHQQGGVRK
ncbi:MAG TPA: hypothetical protein VEX67_01380 [Solirubrobacteraceae bacterium]|nr:hypothetical protein [Solirubrobacteraceae bacterium]